MEVLPKVSRCQLPKGVLCSPSTTTPPKHLDTGVNSWLVHPDSVQQSALRVNRCCCCNLLFLCTQNGDLLRSQVGKPLFAHNLVKAALRLSPDRASKVENSSLDLSGMNLMKIVPEVSLILQAATLSSWSREQQRTPKAYFS